jgi:hypothetical protein
MYLLIVLAAGVATGYWVSHQLGMDLSSITSLASVLGLTETGRTTHGAVGFNTDPSAAPYCSPGQAPTFARGLSDLKQRLGNTMGVPLECAHADSAGGDVVQQTTTGLAASSDASGTVSFTDGWRHWAITPGGFVRWEGVASSPPAGG